MRISLTVTIVCAVVFFAMLLLDKAETGETPTWRAVSGLVSFVIGVLSCAAVAICAVWNVA